MRDSEAHTPGEVFYLSESEVQRLKPLALKGDADAAERLYNHFSLTDRTPAGAAIAARWRQYAAENGSVNAMIAISLELSGTGSSEDCERADFWMARANKIDPEHHPNEKVTCVIEVPVK